jgi:hypothetical protein
MGWTFMHREPGMTTREMIDRELLVDAAGERWHEIIDCAQAGGVFYAAVRTVHENGPTPVGEVWGLVVLTQWASGHFNWGYKAMDEGVGPAEDRCPTRILGLLPEPPPSQCAAEWRARCRANAARRKPRRGDVIRFAQPLSFTNGEELQELIFQSGSTFTRADSSSNYRIPNWQDRAFEFVNPPPPSRSTEPTGGQLEVL